MGRLKALLSHARQPDATCDATTQQGVSHCRAPRECDTRQQPGNGFDLTEELRQPALLALVERVAAHYHTPPAELAEMKRPALADPQAAWECFTADLATLEPGHAGGPV